MRKYFYTSKEKSTRTSTTVYGKVYKLSKGDLLFVCNYEFSTASCRGNVHEVFNALMNCKEIPKKYYKSSECSWSGGGYFEGEVKEKYSIKAL